MDSIKNEINEKLFVACRNGNLAEAKEAIYFGADLKAIDSINYTPLMLACNGGHLEIVKYLVLTKGVDVNQKNEGNGSALMLAVLKNHEGIVEVLLGAGAQVNIQNKSGNTPVFAAAYNGYDRILVLLIKYGADVNLRNYIGTTPIIEAVNRKNIVIVDILIRAGANIYLKNNNEETALKIAALNPINYEIVFRLLSVMSSDEYHLIKQQETANQLTVNEAPKKKRRSRSEDFFRVMSVGLSKMTFGLINPISLQEVKDNNHQAKKSSYFEQYHKAVLFYQTELFSMLGTSAHPTKEGEKSFLDLPTDVIILILSKCYPDWYHYRLKQDIFFIKDKISQALEKRPQPDKVAILAIPSLTFQFAQMQLSSCREENDSMTCEEKFSHSEKSANRIS